VLEKKVPIVQNETNLEIQTANKYNCLNNLNLSLNLKLQLNLLLLLLLLHNLPMKLYKNYKFPMHYNDEHQNDFLHIISQN
jgi:hypothetical protein